MEHFLREVGDYARAEDIKNKSAEQGSLLHDADQNFLVGKAETVPESVQPAVRAFERFNQEAKIALVPEFVERQVWSARHRYAGTVDALATINGKFGVLDIKTSTGFYPEYNLQTAAYVSALQEFDVKRALAVPQEIQTRWILRIDQHRICTQCGSRLREKGGRSKIRNGRRNGSLASPKGEPCVEDQHVWGEIVGDVEMREFPYFYKDVKAFMAAKILWGWENDYWLRQIGYLT